MTRARLLVVDDEPESTKLLVEELVYRPRRDPWLEHGELVGAPVTAQLGDRATLVATAGLARLYRLGPTTGP